MFHYKNTRKPTNKGSYSLENGKHLSLIDLHCDTLWRLLDLGASGDLASGECAVTIAHMKQAGSLAQFFACFGNIDAFVRKGGYDACFSHVLDMIAYLSGQIASYPHHIALATTADEIRQNARLGKVSAILTVEDGGVLNGNMQRLEMLYNRGVRLITLVWNRDNCIGSSCTSTSESGLSPFGIELVREMNRKGMIVDLSHACDTTFNDVLTHAQEPPVASHSNCRAICKNRRNLSDRMIRQLADKGGIAGLNLYGPFLGTPNASLIDEMTAHVMHMINVGGSDFPAIGTDFDGFDGLEKNEIPNIGEIEKLWKALKQKGLNENQLDKIWSKNAMRVIKTTMKK